MIGIFCLASVFVSFIFIFSNGWDDDDDCWTNGKKSNEFLCISYLSFFPIYKCCQWMKSRTQTTTTTTKFYFILYFQILSSIIIIIIRELCVCMFFHFSQSNSIQKLKEKKKMTVIYDQTNEKKLIISGYICSGIYFFRSEKNLSLPLLLSTRISFHFKKKFLIKWPLFFQEFDFYACPFRNHL